MLIREAGHKLVDFFFFIKNTDGVDMNKKSSRTVVLCCTVFTTYQTFLA